jgi:DNA-binding beta-propeller fold protein YncE
MARVLAATAVAAGVACVGTGCRSNSSAQPSAGDSSQVAATPTRHTGRPATPALPKPFRIVARYSAKSLGLSVHPADLAIGPDGNLYVTDLSQRVTMISPAGKVLLRWGKPGSGPGEFRFIPSDPTVPTDVHASIAASPSGEVYVSDSGNGRIQVFAPDGQLIRQFGSYGTGKDQFLLPYDLVVDHAGDIYITDDQASTLTEFAPNGKIIWRVGGGQSADPDLNGHMFATTFDAHGRLVVMNGDVNKVLYIDPSGHVVDSFSPSTAGSPTGGECHATVDTAGNTYVAGCGTDTGPTGVYNQAHRLIAWWPGRPYALFRPPVFGPHGEVFALATDGSILKLRITLPRT